jgi:hypothetical protein
MKKVKFSDGSYTILAIKSDLFAGEGDGVFDPDGNLLKARIRFPSGLARPVTRHGAAWNEIQAVGELRTAKRKTSVRRPLLRKPAKISKEEMKRRRDAHIEKMRTYRASRGWKEKTASKQGKRRSVSESGTYRSFGAWVAAVRRAGGTPNSELSEPQGAFNRSTGQMVGEWDGQEGMIIRRNPVKPRKGETERKFVSRCMSEEKRSFPKVKQRIAVCLSKARKNPLLESGATISKNSGINRRAASMT